MGGVRGLCVSPLPPFKLRANKARGTIANLYSVAPNVGQRCCLCIFLPHPPLHFFGAPVDWLTGFISLSCPGDLRDIFPGRSSLNQRETLFLMCSPALQEGAQLKAVLIRRLFKGEEMLKRNGSFENGPTTPFLSPKNGLLCNLSDLPLTSGNRTFSIVLHALERRLKY